MPVEAPVARVRNGRAGREALVGAVLAHRGRLESEKETER